ncbi:MAG: helix-turn-helix domain-containing protein [Prevotella sp.]|nr:helix-turn-helix domain-containing protein [Prevotella sp.]MDY4218275.1 helix-turn-helix domain-containing protein [Prevotella sp.]
MIEYNEKWILKVNSLRELGTPETQDMVLHGLCVAGTCSFSFNGVKYNLKAGSLFIVRQSNLVLDLQCSDDFEFEGLWFDVKFIRLSASKSRYIIRHILLLYANPVLHLNTEEIELWKRNYEAILFRIEAAHHSFRCELIMSSLWQLCLDCFYFTSRAYGFEEISSLYYAVVNQFFEMLENKEYRKNRSLTYYAEKLCVTPKHLSAMVKRVSGSGAMFWITHFTIIELQVLLRTSSRTVNELANQFNFSSVSHFTRYVQTNLGINPTDLREA